MSSIEKYMNKVGNLKDDDKVKTKSFYGGDRFQSSPQKDQTADSDGSSSSVTINLNMLRSMGLLTPDQPIGQLVDEYRVIKRPVLKNAFDSSFGLDGRNNLVMVTSTFPGEGKTFNSICLAMSIIMEMDYTVMLVETDLSRPSILRYMGISQTYSGVVDVLLGEESDLSRAILKTNIPKLSLLPAGRPHAHTNELMASNNMKSLVDELGNRYKDRIVIFDSPPLLSSSDAAVLSHMVGQILLVIEAGKTEQTAESRSIE